MILRRLGNKKKIAKEIQKYFPPHKIYIEPFFGAGGMFFYKPKAHNNILNDLDSDVFNLFQVVMNNNAELKEAVNKMPYHSDLLEFWKLNKEIEPTKRALRFLFLSNFTFLGAGEAMRYTATKTDYYKNFDRNLLETYDKLFECQFMNFDFEKFLKDISFQTDGRNDEAKTFIYCDPPYINTNDNYSNSFEKSDHIRLHDSLEKTGCKFAISEFDNDFIIQEAKKRNLNIIYIGERQNLKNKRTEILITNYKHKKSLFD